METYDETEPFDNPELQIVPVERPDCSDNLNPIVNRIDVEKFFKDLEEQPDQENPADQGYRIH